MKKLIVLATVVAVSFGCSKKTSEEPKPVAAKGQNAKLNVSLALNDDASPATVSTTSSSGGQFVSVGYNPFSTKPTVGYYAGTLIPVITFPVYSAQIAAAGVSEGCYNEYIKLFSNYASIQVGQDASAICDFIDGLVALSEECSQMTAESKASVKQLSDMYAMMGICN